LDRHFLILLKKQVIHLREPVCCWLLCHFPENLFPPTDKCNWLLKFRKLKLHILGLSNQQCTMTMFRKGDRFVNRVAYVELVVWSTQLTWRIFDDCSW
jgi:hypothetical protein